MSLNGSEQGSYALSHGSYAPEERYIIVFQYTI